MTAVAAPGEVPAAAPVAELLHAPASPFARKVRIVAAECGHRLALTEVFTTPVAPAPEVVALNPLGRIPALRLPSGALLQDSAVICRWLAEGAGPVATGLYPAGAALWPALAREALADGLLEAALAWRYETVLRPAPLRWSDWIAGQAGKLARALAALEAGPALLPAPGAAPDIGQIATGAALGYLDFRFPALDWREGHPRLAGLSAMLEARPSFRAVPMPGPSPDPAPGSAPG